MAAQASASRGPRYDSGIRRKSYRRPKERGVSVYIPAEVLADAGFSPEEPPPFYRLVGHARSRNAGSVIVSLYREP